MARSLCGLHVGIWRVLERLRGVSTATVMLHEARRGQPIDWGRAEWCLDPGVLPLGGLGLSGCGGGGGVVSLYEG